MTAQPWARPAAGREPAAAALLSWLGDPQAPRLCVVTGAEGSGKSALLAWLIAHGTRPGTPSERRVHGFVPLTGQTATTASWMLAEQLQIAARTPGELLQVLAADTRHTVIALPELHTADHPESLTELVLELIELEHVRLLVEARSGTEYADALTAAPCARMDLDDEQWTDRARLEAWNAEQSAVIPAQAAAEAPAAPVELDDPTSVCSADPWQVTAAYERSEDAHGGLRAAWLRAGASLVREQTSQERALVLLAALGDTADPRLQSVLAQLAQQAPWSVVWRRVRGDVSPPWPGPSRSLDTGAGALDGHLVAADHQGTVRVLGLEGAEAAGRLPEPVPGARSVAGHGDGTVSVLDEHGRLHTQRAVPSGAPTGLAALLDDGPSAQDQLVDSVGAYAVTLSATVRPTALATVGSAIVLGDADGTVHAFTGEPGVAAGPAAAASPRTAELHQGSVTALAGAQVTVAEDGTTVPLLYSGGTDGTVRAWAPQADPMPEPVASRPCPVTSVAVATTEAGLVLAVAWSDGFVEHRVLEDGTYRTFHPGSRVHSLALTPEGHLVVGTDEALVRLRPC